MSYGNRWEDFTSASDLARLSAVWPPMVGSTASGRSCTPGLLSGQGATGWGLPARKSQS